MRARSGAIHSDSEQSFAELAEISVNQTGIFYDDKVHTRILTQQQHHKHKHAKATSLRSKPRGDQGSKQGNLFKEFDFNIEFEAVRQEREELERMRRFPRKEINIGIITAEPREIMRHLCLIFGLTVEKQYIVGGISLIVNSEGLNTYKYWVFQKQSLQADSPLMQLYLDHCSLLFEAVTHQQVNVVRHSLGEAGLFESALMANLIY